ncbi:MAG: hypothetical protein GY801_00545 [bacterium]|nr:hypothetical protein [bacterium]
MMKKYFNVAGPCIPGEHHMLPAQERCRGIVDLVDREQYFVIHAARQSGKTTLLQELTEQIHAGRQYYALYCSLESVEIIIRYDTQTLEEGKDQLAGYMDTLGCSEGWLLIFDRRTTVSWEEKIFRRAEAVDGKTIHFVGC